MRDKYIMEVRGGSSLNVEDLEIIKVNDENSSIHISNKHFEGYIKVRLRDYDGLPVDSEKKTLNENSPYFQNNEDFNSIEVCGVFKNGPMKDGAWPASDIYFGNSFNSPLNLPPGISVAQKFATYFDPGLKMDLESSKPYAHSPLLVTMNTLNISKRSTKDPIPDTLSATEGRPIKEDCRILPGLNESEDKDGSARRTLLSNHDNLEKVLLTEETLVRGDFYNPYLDFNKRGIKIPLITIPIMQYWDGQPLSYVCRSLSNPKDNIFFVVSIILRPIDEALSGTSGVIDSSLDID